VRVRITIPGTAACAIMRLPSAQRIAHATKPGLVGGPPRRRCFDVVELRDPDTGQVLAATGGPWSATADELWEAGVAAYRELVEAHRKARRFPLVIPEGLTHA